MALAGAGAGDVASGVFLPTVLPPAAEVAAPAAADAADGGDADADAAVAAESELGDEKTESERRTPAKEPERRGSDMLGAARGPPGDQEGAMRT